GVAYLTLIQPGRSVLAIAVPMILIGSGFGLSMGLVDGAAVSQVETERAGMAVGMFNSIRMSSEVIGFAVAASLVVSLTQNRLISSLGQLGGSSADEVANAAAGGNLGATATAVPAALREQFLATAKSGYTSGLHLTLWALAAICALGMVLVAVLLKNRPQEVAAETSTSDNGNEEVHEPALQATM